MLMKQPNLSDYEILTKHYKLSTQSSSNPCKSQSVQTEDFMVYDVCTTTLNSVVDQESQAEDVLVGNRETEVKDSLVLGFLNRKMGIIMEALDDPSNEIITS